MEIILIVLSIILIGTVKLNIPTVLIIAWWEINIFGKTNLPEMYFMFIFISYLFWRLLFWKSKLEIKIPIQVRENM